MDMRFFSNVNLRRALSGALAMVAMASVSFVPQLIVKALDPARTAAMERGLSLIRSSKTTDIQHRALVEGALEQHWLETAVKAYAAESERRPDDALVQSAFGLAYCQLFQPSIEGYRPGDNAAYRGLSGQRMRDRAKGALENAIKGDGRAIAFCWYAAGWMNVTVPDGSRARGKQQLRKCLQLDPDYIPARNRLSYAYLVHDKAYNPRRALEIARETISKSPAAPKAYAIKASAYFALKRYDAAYRSIIEYEKVAKKPANAKSKALFKEMAEK